MPVELPGQSGRPVGMGRQQPTPTRFLDAKPGTGAASRAEKVKAFIWGSRKRWQTSEAASSTFRNAMRRDQRFAAGMGNQWETEDRQARSDEGRPCIEINRIPQFLRQVSNQNRMNRSAIKVNARGQGATTKLANALQGLVRGIEVESDADVAYDTATDHQLTSGMGFVRLVAQWADDEAFQQVCRIKRVRNPLAVYWDPSAQEADFSDARWMHVIAVMGRDEYEARYGSMAEYQSLTEFMGGTQRMDDWMPEGKVILAEYFYVEMEDRKLHAMSTGKNIWEEEMEHYQQMFALSNPGEPQPTIVRTREVQKRVVRWALHNAIDILEGNDDRTEGRELPGTRIPLFPCMGTELDMDGEVDYRGMVRDARDPQKMYNFWSSSIAEAVALAPKAPWIAAKGQIEQYLDDWKDANRKAKAVLMYDPKAVGDMLVPPPQRNSVEPAIQAMVAGLSEANQDLMSVMGLFEPSLGQRGSHSESGKARELLQQQGTVANSNFLDNLQRMKRSLGRALLEWIPVVYDVPRVVHLLQPEGKKRQAVIYAGPENKPEENEFEGISEMYDVGLGNFDVAIDTGPSYQTEKQATQAWLLEMFKILPPLAEIGVDILLENSDDPAAQQLAKRAKQALPPQYQDDADPESLLPKLMKQVQEQGQLLEMANQAIGTMAKVIESKELEADTKKQVELIKGAVQMSIAAAKLGNERDKALFSAEQQRFSQAADQINAETTREAEEHAAERGDARQLAGSVTQMREKHAADADLAAQNAQLQQAAPGAEQQ